VALDDAVLIDSGGSFEVIDVLGVIGLQAAFVLQKANKGVGRRETLLVREDVAG
jgi:hypothetical protein